MTDLPAVLAALGVQPAPPEHHHSTPGWVNVDCPQCSPGAGKFRLGVARSGRAANCWVCGRMPVLKTLTRLSRHPESRVRQAMAAFWAGGEVRDRWVRPPPAGRLVRPAGVGPMLPAHRRYLAGRGVDPDYAADRWGVLGVGPAVAMQWRLYLPVVLNGEEVSWVTRSIADDPAKPYLAAPPAAEKYRHHDLLYGEDKCGAAIVVVEGPLDAVAGGDGVAATMGVGYSEAQVARIARYPSRAICFDAEPDARRRARRLAAELAPFPGETHVVELETGKDLVRASKREVRELRRRFLT